MVLGRFGAPSFAMYADFGSASLRALTALFVEGPVPDVVVSTLRCGAAAPAGFGGWRRDTAVCAVGLAVVVALALAYPGVAR